MVVVLSEDSLSKTLAEPSLLMDTNNPEAINGLMKVFDTPKDEDGTSITIGDCIEDVIDMLENYDNGGSSTW